MKKTTVLFIIWGILVIIIVGLLTTMGFILKSKTKKYHALEEQLIQSATNYVSDHMILNEEEVIVIDAKQLIDEEYLESLDVSDDSCLGYVIVENKGSYEYSSFITCSSYTTHDYDKNK